MRQLRDDANLAYLDLDLLQIHRSDRMGNKGGLVFLLLTLFTSMSSAQEAINHNRFRKTLSTQENGANCFIHTLGTILPNGVPAALEFPEIYPRIGSSNPISPDGVSIPFKNLHAVIADANTQEEDLLIHLSPHPPNETARIEVPNIKGEVDSIVLQSNSSSINYKNPPIGAKNGVAEISINHSRAFQNSASHFYGFHFIAESNVERDWKLVITTDMSEKRGRELGGILTYETHFSPPVGSPGYVYLPTGSFKSFLNGKLLTSEPSIAEAAYLEKKLKLRSLAFETKTSELPADLKIRNSEVGMGPFSGFNVEQASKVLEQLGRATPYVEDYNLLSGLLLRMKLNSSNFPEGEIFKNLKTDSARRAYLNSELLKLRKQNGIPRFNLADDDLQGAVSFTQIWNSFRLQGTITTETGLFGNLHGRYSHALQIIAMLKDASEGELRALSRVASPREEFNFFWNLALDSRTGDVNDPAWWRVRYEQPNR